MRKPTKSTSPRDESYFIIALQLLSSGRRSEVKISTENEGRSTMTTLSLAEPHPDPRALRPGDHGGGGGIHCDIIVEDLTAPPSTREKRVKHFIARDALTDEEWTRAKEVLTPKPHNLTCLKQVLAFELQHSYIPIGERKR